MPAGNCAKCGVFFPYLQNDHIVPRHLGGGDEPENRQLLCPNCHVLKTMTEIKAHLTGRPLSDAHKQKLRAWNLGRTRSPEDRAKISAGQRGRKLSEETKAKIGAANRGRRRTEEQRRRQSDAHIGQQHTDETKQHLSETLRGRPHPTVRGVPLSTEHRAKVGDAVRRAWAKKKEMKDASETAS